MAGLSNRNLKQARIYTDLVGTINLAFILHRSYTTFFRPLTYPRWHRCYCELALNSGGNRSTRRKPPQTVSKARNTALIHWKVWDELGFEPTTFQPVEYWPSALDHSATLLPLFHSVITKLLSFLWESSKDTTFEDILAQIAKKTYYFLKSQNHQITVKNSNYRDSGNTETDACRETNGLLLRLRN